VGVDPLDAFDARTWHRHDRVMHRQQRLVRQRQRAVAEGFVQQVVRRGDGTDQRVLDGEAAGIGASLAHGGDSVRHLAAGNRLKVGPSAPSRRFAERAVGALNRYAHLGHAPLGAI
jgi:hypothetical protein